MEPTGATPPWSVDRVASIAFGAGFVAVNVGVVALVDRSWVGAGAMLLYLFCAVALPSNGANAARFLRGADGSTTYVHGFRRMVAYPIPSRAIERELRRQADRYDVGTVAIACGAFAWIVLSRSSTFSAVAVRLAVLAPVTLAAIVALNRWWKTLIARRLGPTGIPVDRRRLAVERARGRGLGLIVLGAGMGVYLVGLGLDGLRGITPVSSHANDALAIGGGIFLIADAVRTGWLRGRSRRRPWGSVPRGPDGCAGGPRAASRRP